MNLQFIERNVYQIQYALKHFEYTGELTFFSSREELVSYLQYISKYKTISKNIFLRLYYPTASATRQVFKDNKQVENIPIHLVDGKKYSFYCRPLKYSYLYENILFSNTYALHDYIRNQHPKWTSTKIYTSISSNWRKCNVNFYDLIVKRIDNLPQN